MSYDPSEIQRLFLWRVIANGGEDWFKQIKPGLTKSQRDAMVKAGFLESERRKNPETKGVGLYIRVLDAGWEWAKSNMTASLPSRSNAGAQVLQRLLTRLAAFLEDRQLDLTEVICGMPNAGVPDDAQTAQTTAPPPPLSSRTGSSRVVSSPAVSPAAASPETLHSAAAPAGLADRIANACMKLSRGRANVRVRLAELRQKLAEVSRHDLDQMLLSMSRANRLSLYRLDNPQEIQPEDDAAAVYTASGEPRHIVYFG